eukprot:TRINITY_DN1526_c0_g4_i1.p1 TRINITY_DN1526_c0_g4~~TRINITY_DN1526_c0_g4_i1.p1  ORF type:complete len:1092 (-),score=312.51 TRINITY_DN1526_c0_g4_i1:129-2945(-)
MKNYGLEVVNVSELISDLLSVKDTSELKNCKTAASISVAVIKNFLLNKIEEIIDEEQKVPHDKISEDTEQLFLTPEKISPKLIPSVVDSCYHTIIQSGGKFDLNVFAKNNSSMLETSGPIICSLGARYKQYCSDVARTYLINPTPDQTSNYNSLLAVQDVIIKAIKPGVKLSELYQKGMEVLEKKGLQKNAFPDFGWSIGLEYIDTEFKITGDCQKKISKNMIFNIRVGLQKLKKDAKEYSLLVADTVLIGENGQAEVLTEKALKKIGDVSYELGETNANDSKSAPQKSQKPPPKKAAPPVKSEPVKRAAAQKPVSKPKFDEEELESSGFSLRKNEKLHSIEIGARRLRSTTAREMKFNKNSSQEAKRLAHQKELEDKQIKKFMKLSSQKGHESEDETALSREYISYQSSNNFPIDIGREKIFVDPARESVLLPMYGLMVPFHITTIKSATKNDDYLRVNFKVPGASLPSGPSAFKDLTATYIKELTYRVPDPASLNTAVRLINELKKRVSTRETEIAQKSSLKEQPALILEKPGSRFPKLNHCNIRPNLGGKKSTGVLESHSNGFRFSTKKGKVDIIYSNIKHAFFQPAENSLIVALHFHLHNEIMINKKKTKDVQFYMEVMEASTALGAGRSSSRYGDNEEIEEEQREREIRNKMNKDFQTFVKRMDECYPKLEFDMPYRELGFYGVPFRNNVFLTPTLHCLVNVIEFPFFVMSLEDVQIAFFERVQFSLRNFDLVFVFNNWTEKEVHINTIPMEKLETIKEWLDSCDIKYYEGSANLNWRRLLDSISANPKKFWKDGGWSSLFANSEAELEAEIERMDLVPADPDLAHDYDDYRPSNSEASDYDFEDEDSEDGGGGGGGGRGGGGGGGGRAPAKNKVERIADEDEPMEEEEDAPDWENLDMMAENDDKQAALKRKTRGGGYDSEDDAPAPKRQKR